MSYDPYRNCVNCPERGSAFCSDCREEVEADAEEYGAHVEDKAQKDWFGEVKYV